MRQLKLEEFKQSLKHADEINQLIRSKRESRPLRNKPRVEEEKLLLIESACRLWEQKMIQVGERRWRYVGK